MSWSSRGGSRDLGPSAIHVRSHENPTTTLNIGVTILQTAKWRLWEGQWQQAAGSWLVELVVSQASHWWMDPSVHSPNSSWAPAVSMAPGWDTEDGGGGVHRGALGWPPVSPGFQLCRSLAVRGSGLILELNLGGWGVPSTRSFCAMRWPVGVTLQADRSHLHVRTQEAWTAGAAGWGTRSRGRKPDTSVGLSLPALGEPAERAGESLFWAILPPNCQFQLLASPSDTILRRNKTTGQVRRLGKAFPISAPPGPACGDLCLSAQRPQGRGWAGATGAGLGVLMWVGGDSQLACGLC